MIAVPEHMTYTAYYAMGDVGTDGLGKREHLVRPVICWNDEGEPLVPDHLGCLVPASSLSGLQSVNARQKGDLVGVLPGGGWTLHMTNHESGASWEQPLVAWTVHRSGQVHPLLPDYDAVPEGVTPVDPIAVGHPWQGTYSLSHPDQSEVTYDEEGEETEGTHS